MYLLCIVVDYRLFIDQSKLDQKCREHLMVDQEGGVKIFGYDEVVAHVNDITNQNVSGNIWVSIQFIIRVML